MQRSRQGARRHRLDQKDIGAGGARRRLILAAAGYADDRNPPKAIRQDAGDRLVDARRNPAAVIFSRKYFVFSSRRSRSSKVFDSRSTHAIDAATSDGGSVFENR